MFDGMYDRLRGACYESGIGSYLFHRLGTFHVGWTKVVLDLKKDDKSVKTDFLS